MKKAFAISCVILLAALSLTSFGAVEHPIRDHHTSLISRTWNKVLRLSSHVRSLEIKSRRLEKQIAGMREESDELRSKVVTIEEQLAAPKTISWKHTIAPGEISGTGGFLTVRLADPRIEKDADVSVYVVHPEKNVSFISINAAYDIWLSDGVLELRTAWSGDPLVPNPPIGVELLIFLTYPD